MTKTVPYSRSFALLSPAAHLPPGAHQADEFFAAMRSTESSASARRAPPSFIVARCADGKAQLAIVVGGGDRGDRQRIFTQLADDIAGERLQIDFLAGGLAWRCASRSQLGTRGMGNSVTLAVFSCSPSNCISGMPQARPCCRPVSPAFHHWPRAWPRPPDSAPARKSSLHRRRVAWQLHRQAATGVGQIAAVAVQLAEAQPFQRVRCTSLPEIKHSAWRRSRRAGAAAG